MSTTRSSQRAREGARMEADLRIRRRLERGEAGADDKHAAAEAAKRALDARRPEQEAADGEDGEAWRLY